jgi:hypothetical protein
LFPATNGAAIGGLVKKKGNRLDRERKGEREGVRKKDKTAT